MKATFGPGWLAAPDCIRAMMRAASVIPQMAIACDPGSGAASPHMDIVSCLCPRRPEPARFERSGWRGAAFGAAIARRSGVWWPSRLATAPRCGVFPTPAAYESLIAACLKTRIAGFGRAPLRSGGVPARWAGIARPADKPPKPRIRTSPLTHQSHGPVRPLIG